MTRISAKVQSRLQLSLKRFQGILSSAKARDVNESDTVTIVVDVLSEIFGYDKYAEITSEYAIRGTYVDLAIKLDGKLHLLVEVKAIGQTLDERHLKQAVDYAANQGVDWVVLTNGTQWRAYKVTFTKPIGQDLVMDLDLLALNPRSVTDMANLFPLTKEGISKSALQAHHEQRQATNRYVLGAIVQSDPVLEMVRREVRRLTPGIRIELAEIRTVVQQEVLKRELVDSENAKDAAKKVKRASGRRLRITNNNGDESTGDDGAPEAEETAEPAV